MAIACEDIIFFYIRDGKEYEIQRTEAVFVNLCIAHESIPRNRLCTVCCRPGRYDKRGCRTGQPGLEINSWTPLTVYKYGLCGHMKET